MDAVYLETSIIGYLASRLSSDLITAGNQRLTRDLWDNHRESFDLFVSQAVVAECSTGDSDAANERLVYLADLPILDITDDARIFPCILRKQEVNLCLDSLNRSDDRPYPHYLLRDRLSRFRPDPIVSR